MAAQDPRGPEGFQLPALGATLNSCSVSPLRRAAPRDAQTCPVGCDAFPVVLGVSAVFRPAVAQCCTCIARPSLCDLLLKTRCVVGVENRSSINLSSWWCGSVSVWFASHTDPYLAANGVK